MKKKIVATAREYRLWLLVVLIAIVLSPVLLGSYQFYRLQPSQDTPGDLPDIKIAGRPSTGKIYFEASDFMLPGTLWSAGNYALVLDRATNQIETYKRFDGFGMGLERKSETLVTAYQIPANRLKLQQNFNPSAGIPFDSGGDYLLLDENLNYQGQVSDNRGIDLHELVQLDNGNFMYLVEDIRPLYRDPTLTCLPPGYCAVLGQSIVEVTPDGETVWKWDLLDHYTRDDFIMDDMLIKGHTMLYDVTHANALEVLPDGNLLISVRHTNQIIKIDRSTGDIIWRLGGKDSDFVFMNDRLNGFSHQHAPVMLDNGHILIFDNGNGRIGETLYSRAVEYYLDESIGTATLVWQYITPEKHFSPNRGSVQRLANGNTLVNFVSRTPGNILEVAPEGEIVLEISLPNDYASYRAQYWGDGQ